MSTGLELRREMADFPAGRLAPGSDIELSGCLRVELRYDTGFAIQGRILEVLEIDGQRPFKLPGASVWTPHSGRSFMPSSTAAFRVPKEGQRLHRRLVRQG